MQINVSSHTWVSVCLGKMHRGRFRGAGVSGHGPGPTRPTGGESQGLQSSCFMGSTCHQMFLITKTTPEARTSRLSQFVGGAGSLLSVPPGSRVRGPARPGAQGTGVRYCLHHLEANRGTVSGPDQVTGGGSGPTGPCGYQRWAAQQPRPGCWAVVPRGVQQLPPSYDTSKFWRIVPPRTWGRILISSLQTCDFASQRGRSMQRLGSAGHRQRPAMLPSPL